MSNYLSIVLVHDTADNTAQINAVLAMLDVHPNGPPYYLFPSDTGVLRPVVVHHIIPTGQNPPVDTLAGTKTWYTSAPGATAHLNRGWLRVLDLTAARVLLVTDYTLLTEAAVYAALDALSPAAPVATEAWDYLMTMEITQQFGYMDDAMDPADAWAAYVAEVA